jgi:ActR/RegA family two-component response regulator
MNGVELAREIQRRRSDIPVLLTSGYAEAAVHDAETAGIRILSKPYHIDELAAALSAAKSDFAIATGSALAKTRG